MDVYINLNFEAFNGAFKWDYCCKIRYKILVRLFYLNDFSSRKLQFLFYCSLI